jgi:DNA-binding transcriptional regulator/RsmH inhibitor MraZ
MHCMVAQSIPSEIDEKDRLSIPKELRDHTDMGSELVLSGLYDRPELWSPSCWEACLL